jgi:hypothetical protein
MCETHVVEDSNIEDIAILLEDIVKTIKKKLKQEKT